MSAGCGVQGKAQQALGLTMTCLDLSPTAYCERLGLAAMQWIGQASTRDTCRRSVLGSSASLTHSFPSPPQLMMESLPTKTAPPRPPAWASKVSNMTDEFPTQACILIRKATVTRLGLTSRLIHRLRQVAVPYCLHNTPNLLGVCNLTRLLKGCQPCPEPTLVAVILTETSHTPCNFTHSSSQALLHQLFLGF